MITYAHRIWDAIDYYVCVTIRGQGSQARGTTPTCLAAANVLVSGWSDGKMLAHDIDTGQNLWFIDNAHIDGVTAIHMVLIICYVIVTTFII